MSRAPSIWDEAKAKGHSRRAFLQFCSTAAAAAGLTGTGVTRVVHAFSTDGPNNPGDKGQGT